MPIFSNRTLVSLLLDLPQNVRNRCQADLVGRIGKGGREALAAEWELFSLRQMARSGTLRLAPADQSGVPDAIFSPEGAAPVVAEVTAIDDRDLEAAFADDALGLLFYRALIKQTKTPVGVFDVQTTWPVGEKGLPSPGLPPRSQLHEFMRTSAVRQFIQAIASAPGATRALEHRLGESVTHVTFRPGAEFSSGSVSGLTARGFNEHNRGRLLRKLSKKVKQLADSNLQMPAVVILCDADCRMLQEQVRPAWDKRGAAHAIFDFISGRPAVTLPSPGRPWIIQHGAPQQTTSINAVIVLTIDEKWNAWSLPRTQRELKVTVIPNKGKTKYPLPDKTLQTLIQGLSNDVPPILRTPMNAKHPQKFADNEGAGKVSGERVTIPLLALQDLLTGRMTQEAFQQSHEFLAEHLQRLTSRGQCISAARIVPDDEGHDDDWIELDFSGIDPRDFRRLMERGDK